MKNKVGLSKGLSPDMFKTSKSNFSLSQFNNIKGGGRMKLKNNVNNVKDLLSISPSVHTNKANMLMSLGSRKTGKSLDGIENTSFDLYDLDDVKKFAPRVNTLLAEMK